MPLELPAVGLDEEDLTFRETLRRFFETALPMSDVRAAIDSDSGLAEAVWKSAAQALRLPGLALPEACGGEGFGPTALALALAEAARGLAPLPLFPTSGLAARAVLAVEGEAGAPKSPWLAALADGCSATLAWSEHAGEPGLGRVETELDAAGRLHGEKRWVLHGASAERCFVVARRAGTEALVLAAVEAGAPGLGVRPRQTLDPTRRVATLRFDGTPAGRVGEGDEDARPALERAFVEATALLCAEMAGSMERVLESAVDYAVTRQQFGRAIGSFQAIKHKAADMLIAFEAGRTAAHAAVRACEAADPEAALLASVAKACVSRGFVELATENLQIHGGVGYTWEYDAHLYFRRAHASAALLGDAAWHERRLVDRIETRPPAHDSSRVSA